MISNSPGNVGGVIDTTSKRVYNYHVRCGSCALCHNWRTYLRDTEAMTSCDNTRVKGRKWGTQRLPRSLILAIRQLAESRGISPSDCIALAFESSPELFGDFERALHPWKGLLDTFGGLKQSELPLSTDSKI